MLSKLSGILFFALICCCAPGFGQTSFQGLTAGSSTRSDVERVLGKPVHTIDEASQYKPLAGIANVVVVYNKSSTADRIDVFFIKPITRVALLRKFGLPLKPDTTTKTTDGSLEELFGGKALLVMLYQSATAASGVVRLVYCSETRFGEAVAAIHKRDAAKSRREAVASTVSGTWKGTWKNNLGVKGSSVMNITEGLDGTLKGDDGGSPIVKGRRIGSVLTWDMVGLNKGCRNYKVQMKLSDDGHTLAGTYEVTDRCAKKTYSGRYDNYVKQ